MLRRFVEHKIEIFFFFIMDEILLTEYAYVHLLDGF